MFPRMLLKSFTTTTFAFLLFFSMIQPLCVYAQDGDEEEERAKYQPPRDYGEDWRLASLFGISPEDGVLLGTGAILYKFGFREFPYIYRMSLVGGATITTGRWKFMYTGLFPSLAKNLSFDLLAYASELEVRNFYGFGNGTPRDEGLEKNNYYRVASRQYVVQPELHITFNAITSLGIALVYKHFDTRNTAGRFIETQPLPLIGDRRSIVGTGISLTVASGDAAVATRNGISFRASVWNYPDPFRNATPFQRYTGDMRGYLSEGIATLALRAYGEKVRGYFPFYEAAFLGGGSSVRGYLLNRFSGDAALGGSAELRFELFRIKLFVPTTVGVFVFGDAGRVYVEDTSPGGWHADAGGGISLAPISRDLTLSFSIANSPEGIFVNGGFGFAL